MSAVVIPFPQPPPMEAGDDAYPIIVAFYNGNKEAADVFLTRLWLCGFKIVPIDDGDCAA